MQTIPSLQLNHDHTDQILENLILKDALSRLATLHEDNFDVKRINAQFSLYAPPKITISVHNIRNRSVFGHRQRFTTGFTITHPLNREKFQYLLSIEEFNNT